MVHISQLFLTGLQCSAGHLKGYGSRCAPVLEETRSSALFVNYYFSACFPPVCIHYRLFLFFENLGRPGRLSESEIEVAAGESQATLASLKDCSHKNPRIWDVR